ncbi:hypothetical protein AWU65_14605 [Paenibacillus glucanolyticus]|uniref:Protein NO VEIN C-terminal domain-containing protein n=1 Tax=Paenibacillus glucanolyticus TaxID=59843 RepID=A0A163K971_9BACL|nr:DUF3883 domain-containing protein [Paenibacillus glucanolyticus]KZS47068.1 hypothetical protein AWU65_14605 [Paenibacillus glucanolyticus]
MPKDWSKNEVELIVTDYMNMLITELKGETYNKSVNAEKLKPMLSDRSRGSIEFKHCNISAAMIDKGLPYVEGYKPRGNYQTLVSHTIDVYFKVNTHILDIFDKITESGFIENVDVKPNADSSLLELLEDCPTISDKGPKRRGGFPNVSVDYIDRENRNKTLGEMGEQLIYQYEQERLQSLGRGDLASCICWASKEIGDGLGYDIKSYNIDGTERFIEVKTTNFGKCYPFYFTMNELLFSEKHFENYYLYRVFNFKKKKRLFIMNGSLSSICKNTPTHFRGHF